MLLTILFSLTVLCLLTCGLLHWVALQAEQVNRTLQDTVSDGTTAAWDLIITTEELNSIRALYQHDLEELSHTLGNAAMRTQDPLVLDSLNRVRGSNSLLHTTEGMCCLNWVLQGIVDHRQSLTNKLVLLKSPDLMVSCCEENVERVLQDVLTVLSAMDNKIALTVLATDSKFATLEILYRSSVEIPESSLQAWKFQMSRCHGTVGLSKWSGEVGRCVSIKFPLAN